MIIKSMVSIAIYTILVFVPCSVFAHPGHGTSTISELLHNVLYHHTYYYALIVLLLVFLAGLGVRRLRLKQKLE